jgi:hypothetical protein
MPPKRKAWEKGISIRATSRSRFIFLEKVERLSPLYSEVMLLALRLQLK